MKQYNFLPWNWLLRKHLCFQEQWLVTPDLAHLNFYWNDKQSLIGHSSKNIKQQTLKLYTLIVNDSVLRKCTLATMFNRLWFFQHIQVLKFHWIDVKKSEKGLEQMDWKSSLVKKSCGQGPLMTNKGKTGFSLCF